MPVSGNISSGPEIVARREEEVIMRSCPAYQRRFSRQLRDWRSVYSEVSWVQSSPVYRLETRD